MYHRLYHSVVFTICLHFLLHSYSFHPQVSLTGKKKRGSSLSLRSLGHLMWRLLLMVMTSFCVSIS